MMRYHTVADARLSRRRLLLGSAAALAAPSIAARSQAIARNLVLHRGVNTWPWFSLTREYPPPRTDYAWPPFQEQRPVPRPADLKRLRAAGLDFVRIPVDPGPFLAFAGSQRAALDDMLFAAIDECLAAGLSVVLNIQASGTHYYTPDRMYGSRTAPEFGAYLDLVRQAARGLARFDPARVALEPVNEPPQGCVSAEWTDVQTALLTAARRAAPALTLVASGGCGSMIAGLLPLDPAPLLALGPILFTFHFYEPYLFSHQGATWMGEKFYRDLNDVPWPASAGSLAETLAAVRARMAQDNAVSPAAKQEAYAQTEQVLKVYFDAQPARPFLQKYLSAAADWCARHRIPPGQVLMGEFGALRSDAQYVSSHPADRARYIRDVREVAESYGFPWAFWCLFDGMAMMDDTTRALDPAIAAALGLSA